MLPQLDIVTTVKAFREAGAILIISDLRLRHKTVSTSLTQASRSAPPRPQIPRHHRQYSVPQLWRRGGGGLLVLKTAVSDSVDLSLGQREESSQRL